MPEQLHEAMNEMPRALPANRGSKVFFVFALFFFFASFIIFGMLFTSGLFGVKNSSLESVNTSESLQQGNSGTDGSIAEELFEEDDFESTVSQDPSSMIDEQLKYMDGLNLSDFENDYRETSLNDL
jgi:hypothetical protein